MFWSWGYAFEQHKSGRPEDPRIVKLSWVIGNLGMATRAKRHGRRDDFISRSRYLAELWTAARSPASASGGYSTSLPALTTLEAANDGMPRSVWPLVIFQKKQRRRHSADGQPAVQIRRPCFSPGQCPCLRGTRRSFAERA